MFCTNGYKALTITGEERKTNTKTGIFVEQ